MYGSKAPHILNLDARQREVVSSHSIPVTITIHIQGSPSANLSAIQVHTGTMTTYTHETHNTNGP
jgi:hypothetical protein